MRQHDRYYRVPAVPWERDRFALVGLSEMLRFYAGLVFIGARDFAGHVGLLTSLVVDGCGEEQVRRYKGTHEGILQTFRELLDNPEEWPLTQRLHRKAERLHGRMATEDMSITTAVVLLKELMNDLVEELSGPWFLMIPTNRRYLYEQRSPLFERAVHETFPEACADIEAAGRCLALDEWTAAVFHLMRVLERGLHWFANELQIGMAETVELENWKNIIDQIESRIRGMEQLPKSPEKAAMLQRYSEMAANLWFFKEAWRNHVAHSRSTYDERRAMNIFSHVRHFMQEAAAAAKGDPS
ncbi:MAG: hypothetical protein AB7O30_07635 [Dehalococcoidia bacterium]